MALANINSAYAGEHAGQYLSQALKSAQSLDYMTTLEGIKYKRTLTTVDSSSLIQAANCSFSDNSTVTLAERVLTVKRLEINTDVCKTSLVEDFMAAQMRAGAHNDNLSDDFAAFMVSYLGNKIADHIEGNIWTGSGSGGNFSGFTASSVGTLLASNDSTVVQVDKTAAFTSATIEANLKKVVDNIPTAVYSKPDTYVYLNVNSYRAYLEAQASNSTAFISNMGDDFRPMYNGIKLAVCPGMADDTLVAAQSSNLFYGTDLMSDMSELKIMDMSEVTGDDVVRFIAKFGAGVQHGIGADVVLLD